MKTVIIDPEFEDFRQYIENCPETFNSLGKIIESRRNIIREDLVNGKRLVIKSYRRIYLANRIRYTYFTKSKAQRAYDYAKILLGRGFNTPKPVAYIEIIERGLITQSFFISEFLDYRPLFAPGETDHISLDLILELARYTFKLHEREIYHVDYNVGNILVGKVNDQWDFALVDINRMKFGPVSFRKGIRNMVTLGLTVDQLTLLLKEYGRLWNVDEEQCLESFFKLKRNELRKRGMKRSLKDFVGWKKHPPS